MIVKTNREKVNTYSILTDTLLDANFAYSCIKVVTGSLSGTGGAVNSKIFAWQNTGASAAIIILKVVIDVVTKATNAGSNIDVGVSATDATAATLINGASLGTSGTSRTNFDATTGVGCDNCADDYYITGYSDGTADPAGLAGKYYIYYITV